MRSLSAVLLVTLVILAGLTSACGSMQGAASKDPMKCERDPKCAHHERTFDCSTQCSDDPVCVDRCREVQEAAGTSRQ